MSDNRWNKEAGKHEVRKECNSITDEKILIMQTEGKTAQFEGEDMKLKNNINTQKTQKTIQKCNIWLEQNLTRRTTSAIMLMLEKKVETRAWKKVRVLTENSQCRLRKE